LAAGIVGWLVGEGFQGYYKPEIRMVPFVYEMRPGTTAETENAASLKNAVLAFGILSGIIGFGMGVAGGLASRSIWREVIAGLVGGALGAGVAILGARALLPIYYKPYAPNPNDFLTPLRVHGGIWLAMGAVGGLAFVVGFGAWRRVLLGVIGGCVGAALATTTYHILIGFLLSEPFEPVATSVWVRLLASVLLAVLIAAGAAGGTLGSLPASTPSKSSIPHEAPSGPSTL
jgi:hypothetical protein